MTIMVKSMRIPTRKMALVADAGTTVVSKRASSKTANLTVSAERFLKMALSFKACGSKDGDMVKVKKSHVTATKELAPGTIITISNKFKMHPYEHQ